MGCPPSLWWLPIPISAHNWIPSTNYYLLWLFLFLSLIVWENPWESVWAPTNKSHLLILPKPFSFFCCLSCFHRHHPTTASHTTIPCKGCWKAERSITHHQGRHPPESQTNSEKKILSSLTSLTRQLHSPISFPPWTQHLITLGHYIGTLHHHLVTGPPAQIPSSQAPWSVVVGKGLSGHLPTASPLSLTLTNHFATLPCDVSIHPTMSPRLVLFLGLVSLVGYWTMPQLWQR